MRFDIRNPKQAMQLGIETIYQYNSMVPTMSIARNLFVGREPLEMVAVAGFGVMDQKRMRQESVQAIADVDLHLRSPDAHGRRALRRPAPGRRHRARHAFQVEDPRPRRADQSPVGQGDQQGARLHPGPKAQNVTGIFISHNMHHVFQSCDRIVAMARGEIVFDRPVAECSIEEVHELM